MQTSATSLFICKLNWKLLYYISDEKKVPGAVISKDGHADNLLGRERPFTIDFSEKAASRKIGFCCQLL